MTRDQDASVSRRDVLVGMAALWAAPVLATDAPQSQQPKGPARASGKVDLERFVADVVSANRGSDAQRAVAEVLARAVSNPRAMLAAVGEPRRAGITPLHRSATLTIFSAAWTPQMNLLPHNHRMWAVIGIYTGREDNILWQPSSKRPLTAVGAQALFEGDIATLPATAIHSVTNPLPRFTGGIHIYGGDFFATERTQWNPETLAEEPSNGDVIREMFERENAKLDLP